MKKTSYLTDEFLYDNFNKKIFLLKLLYKNSCVNIDAISRKNGSIFSSKMKRREAKVLKNKQPKNEIWVNSRNEWTARPKVSFIIWAECIPQILKLSRTKANCFEIPHDKSTSIHHGWKRHNYTSWSRHINLLLEKR